MSGDPCWRPSTLGITPIITYHRKQLRYLSMGLHFGFKELHVSAATRWDVSMIKSLTETLKWRLILIIMKTLQRRRDEIGSCSFGFWRIKPFKIPKCQKFLFRSLDLNLVFSLGLNDGFVSTAWIVERHSSTSVMLPSQQGACRFTNRLLIGFNCSSVEA